MLCTCELAFALLTTTAAAMTTTAQGALLMALSFDAFLNPPDFDATQSNLTDIEIDMALVRYGIAFGCAVMISTSLVMVSIMLIVNLHTLVHDEDVVGYLLQFGYYRIVLLLLVTALSISMLAGVSVTASAAYPPKVFTAVLALGSTSIVIVLGALAAQVRFTKAATSARLAGVTSGLNGGEKPLQLEANEETTGNNAGTKEAGKMEGNQQPWPDATIDNDGFF